MKRLLSSIFLLCGVVFAIAAAPVFGQSDEIVINKKPLKDFAVYANAKNVDWTKPFTIEAEAVLTKDGRFDKEKTKFTKTEGDAATIEAIKRAFETVDESGKLVYLSNSGMKEIKIFASQTADSFSVLLVLEQPTPEKAKTFSSGLNAMVAFALREDETKPGKLSDDLGKLLRGLKVTAQEKTVTMNISLAAGDFQEMIKRRLNEEKK